MSADLRTQAKSLTLACSVVNGDIFLVFPDCHVRRIDREDWLRDVEFVCSMKPTPSADFRFATAGMTFELIKYEDCHICGGDGIEVGPEWIYEDADGVHGECATHGSGHPRKAVYVEEREHNCCTCGGSGVLYTWTGQLVTRGDLLGEVVAS